MESAPASQQALKAGEILFKEFAVGDAGGRAVLAADDGAVCQIVLEAGSDIVHADVVGILTLETEGEGGGHAAVDEDILAEAFPYAGPEGGASDVHHRAVYPGDEAGAGLIGGNLADAAGDGDVERCTLAHFLGEERSAEGVVGTVDLIDAIEFGHTVTMEGADAVDGADDVSPYGGSLCVALGDVEDGSDVVLAEDVVDSLCGEHTAGEGAG